MEDMKKLILAFEELLFAATEYAEYEHDGDPWKEDARVMGEMELDFLMTGEKIKEYNDLLVSVKEQVVYE